jgi:hypothetical protein
MTIRAHKPEFNFREKLKELDSAHVPYEKMPPGSVIQVTYGFTITQVEASMSSETSLGLSATISPKFASSKILVCVNMAGCGTRDADTLWNSILKRNSTNLSQLSSYTGYRTGSGVETYPSQQYLDSPQTTSEITYAMYGVRAGGSANCYATHSNGINPRLRSTITLMEIKQ